MGQHARIQIEFSLLKKRIRLIFLGLTLMLSHSASSDPLNDMELLQRKALAAFENGDYVRMEQMSRQVHELAVISFGKQDPDTAVLQGELALSLYHQGRYTEAIKQYQEAQKILRAVRGDRHADTLDNLNGLAQALNGQGNYQEAEKLHRRILEIRRGTLGEKDPLTLRSLNNLADTLSHQGRLDEAEVLHRQRLRILGNTPAQSFPGTSFDATQLDIITAQNNLAIVLLRKNQFAEAHRLLLDNLTRQKTQYKSPDHPDIAKTHNALSSLFLELGELEEARKAVDEALVIQKKKLGENHPSTVNSKNSKALLVYKQAKRYEVGSPHRKSLLDDAELLCEEALAATRKSFDKYNLKATSILNTLGLILMAQNRWVDAEKTFRLALDTRKEAKDDSAHVIRLLDNLAITLVDQQRDQEAEQYYRESITLARTSDAQVYSLSANAHLGALLVRQNRLPEAVAPYDTAVQILDQLFASTRGLPEEFRHTFVGQYASIYRDFIQLLLSLHAQQPQAGHDRKALEIASRQQSRVFTELLRQAQVRGYDRDPVFQELKVQRDSLRTQVATLTEQRTTVPVAAPEADAKKANLSRALEEKREALRAVDERLRRDYPRFVELEQPAPVTVDALQALLQPGEAVWTLVMLPEQTALFVVTRDRFRLQPVEVSRQKLTDQVARVRRPLEQVSKQKNNLAPATDLDPADLHQLYQHLITPVSDLLQDARRMLVVADGPLYNLPLELLVTRFGEAEIRAFGSVHRLTEGNNPDRAYLSQYATLDYLDNHYRFQYLPSLAALVAQRRLTQASSTTPGSATTTDPAISPPPTLIAFADPIFGPEELPTQNGTTRGVPTSPDYSAATQTTLQLLTRSGALKKPLLRLSDTADEARAIAGLLRVDPQRHLYLRARAQEQTLYDLNDRGQLRGLRYLLFSTHGLLGGQFLSPEAPDTPDTPLRRTNFASAVEPREPALALTLVGDLHGQDGFLKMSEVLGLNLDTDLVVLSACNTAGEVAPKDNRGEGFVGLTRTFLFAGARRLLVSHWNVDSAASRELMTATFTRLQAGQAPADALADARREIRHQTFQIPGSGAGVAYAHPYFWAPFVVVGD